MRTRLHLLGTLAMCTLSSAAWADGATLSGTVKWAGPPPSTPAPMKVTQDHKACGHSKASEALLVDKASGGVRNVVVSLTNVPGATKPAPAEVSLDQKECSFLPHVQALPVGSTLVLTSADEVLHNIHAHKADGSTLFNVAIPLPNTHIKKKISAKGLTSLRCDAGHVWMSAYLWTFDHPYYAVTDASGKFSIANVPPGSYTMRVWHEGWKPRAGAASPLDTQAVTMDVPVQVAAGTGATVTVDLR